jgi:hypothetical protein
LFLLNGKKFFVFLKEEMSLFGASNGSQTRSLNITNQFKVSTSLNSNLLSASGNKITLGASLTEVKGTLQLDAPITGEINSEDRNPLFNYNNEGSGSFGIQWGYPSGATGYLGGLYYDATNNGEFALYNSATGGQLNNVNDLTLSASNFAPLNVSKLYTTEVDLVSGAGTGAITFNSGNVYIPTLRVDSITGSNSYFSSQTYGSGTGMVFNQASIGSITGGTAWISSTGYFGGGMTATTGYFSNSLRIAGTGYFSGGFSGTTGYMSGLLFAGGGISGTINSMRRYTPTANIGWLIAGTGAWSYNNSNTYNGTYYAMKWSPKLALFCAVQNNSNITIYSADGYNWKSGGTVSTDKWFSMAWSPALGMYACVSNNANTTSQLTTSPDCINWGIRTCPTGIWQGICWSEDLSIFCAVAKNSATGTAINSCYSSDGANWTGTSIPASGAWNTIVWSGELGYFVSTQNGTNSATSPDGINWTIHSGATPNYNWDCIAYSPELVRFVSCAYNSQKSTVSSDGITWSAVNTISASAGACDQVIWASELGIFIVICESTTAGLFISPDGYTWTNVSPAFQVTKTITPHSGAWSPELGIFSILGNNTYPIISGFLRQLAFGNGGNRVFNSVQTYLGISGSTGYFSGQLNCAGGITGSTTYHSGMGTFSGGITGTTAYHSGMITATGGITGTTAYHSGTGYFAGGITASTGYFTNIVSNGGTGTTSYHSGTGFFAGGITASTGFFGNSLSVAGTGIFGGGITASSGYFNNLLELGDGLTGKSSFFSSTGTFVGGLTASTGYFDYLTSGNSSTASIYQINSNQGTFNNINVVAGLICQGVVSTNMLSGNTGYFTGQLTCAGGITASAGYFSSLSLSNVSVPVMTLTSTGYFGGGMTATTGYFNGLLKVAGGITGTSTYFSSTGRFAGGITSTTGVFGNSLLCAGTGYFGGGITATTGFFTNQLTVSGTGYFAGGLTATTGYFVNITSSGASMNTLGLTSTGTFGGGITATTGYFSSLSASGMGIFLGGLTATTGYFCDLLTATGGITGTTLYFSSTGYFAGGMTASTGVFGNSLLCAGTGYFDGGITGSTGYFSGSLSVGGGISAGGQISADGLRLTNNVNQSSDYVAQGSENYILLTGTGVRNLWLPFAPAQNFGCVNYVSAGSNGGMDIHGATGGSVQLSGGNGNLQPYSWHMPIGSMCIITNWNGYEYNLFGQNLTQNVYV